MDHPDFPHDVWRMAVEAADRVQMDGSEAHACAVAVATMILAERERCAKIAEDWELVERILPLADDSHNEAALTGQNEASERIAVAIRREPVSVQRPDITVRSRTESEQNAGETGYKHE